MKKSILTGIIAFICLTGAITGVLVAVLSSGSTSNNTFSKHTSVAPSEQVSPKNQSTSKAPTDYQGKKGEMLDALNSLESKNNYRSLYRGLSMRENNLTIEVSDSWSLMSTDEKIDFVNHIRNIWFIMCKARKIDINTDDFYMTFTNSQPSYLVATWDSVRGPRIIK